MKQINFYLLLLTMLFMTACSNLSPPPITYPEQTAPSWKKRELSLKQFQQWRLLGKIGIRTPNEAGSASIDWIQQHNDYQLSLIGPLGTGSVQLKGNNQRVHIKLPNNKLETASSAEKLLFDQWGYQLPVTYLQFWVKGLPAPNQTAKTVFDHEHRLAQLQQAGWIIDFSDYRSFKQIDLPQYLQLTSPQLGLKIKLIIHQWMNG